MIDINELRRLAQAATPGPWKMLPVGDGRQKFAVANSEFLSILTVTDEGGATFGTVYDDADARFIAAANPAAINELLDRLEAAEKERDEFKRECFGHISDNSLLRAKIEAMEKQEPVAWCATDETGTVIEALGMNQSRRFDTALYRAPGAQPTPSIPEISDDLIEAIESRAEQSYRRHHGGIRGQQVTPADALSWHIIHATRDVLATAPSNGIWEQDGYGDNPDARPLYALPGAKGEGK